MEKRIMFAKAGTAVVSTFSGILAAQTVKAHAPQETPLQKVIAVVGAFGVSWYVSKKISEEMDNYIDDTFGTDEILLNP